QSPSSGWCRWESHSRCCIRFESLKNPAVSPFWTVAKQMSVPMMMGYHSRGMNPRSARAQRESEAALNALLERYRAGDGSALNAIMVEVYPLVHRFVFRLVGAHRHELHEDLVQASLEQLCGAIDGFEGRSRMSTFVFGICYRVVARQRRAERIRNLFRRVAE